MRGEEAGLDLSFTGELDSLGVRAAEWAESWFWKGA